jgi:hypothetical protein
MPRHLGAPARTVNPRSASVPPALCARAQRSLRRGCGCGSMLARDRIFVRREFAASRCTRAAPGCVAETVRFSCWAALIPTKRSRVPLRGPPGRISVFCKPTGRMPVPRGMGVPPMSEN